MKADVTKLCPHLAARRTSGACFIRPANKSEGEEAAHALARHQPSARTYLFPRLSRWQPRVVHAVLIVDDERVGNETVAEVQSSYVRLQQDLITHYREAWEKREIMWPKGATKTGRKRVDNRPLLPGGYPS